VIKLPKEARGYFLQSLLTICVVKMPLLLWRPSFLTLEVQRQRREADHSSPSIAEVRNEWRSTSPTAQS